MKATIESTSKVIDFLVEDSPNEMQGRSGSYRVIPCRIWEGVTENGVSFHAYIVRVAVKEGQEPSQYEQFQKELGETRAPSAEVAAIPLRLIL